MSYILLLLVFELVAADKLDRRYLPPPGAKYSGGNSDELLTPLEYPKENNPDYIDDLPNHASYQKFATDSPSNQIPQDGPFDATVSDRDYVTSTHPSDFGTMSSVPTTTSTVPTLNSKAAFLDDFPLISPTNTFTTSQNLINSEPIYFVPISSSENLMKSYNNIFKKPSNQNYDSNYYYYMNKIPQYDDNIAAKKTYESNGILNSERVEYSNQEQSSDKHNILLKTVDNKDNKHNDEPHTFGHYGGKPMVMIFQNDDKPDKHISEFEKLQINNNTLINQDKSRNKGIARPFQTPLVQTNAQQPNKTIYSTNNINELLSTKTNKTPKKTKNIVVQLDQRTNVPLHSINKTKSDRPRTKFESRAEILKYDSEISPDSFSYAFDTSNGIHVDESGTAIDGVKAKGSYSYTGDDGKIYTVNYTADENGFQAKGDHLPTAPPIPEAIMKVIEQAERDKVAGIFDDGSYDENKYGHQNYYGAMERYPEKKSRIPNVIQRAGSTIYKPTENHKNTSSNVRKSNTNVNTDDLYVKQKPATKIQSSETPPYLIIEHNKSRSMSPFDGSDKNNDAYGHNNKAFEPPVSYFDDLKPELVPVENMNNSNFPLNNKNSNDTDYATIAEPENNKLNAIKSFVTNPNDKSDSLATSDNRNVSEKDLKYNDFSENYTPNKSNELIKGKLNQDNNRLSKTTSYDKGYLYVPPIDKFYETEYSDKKKQPFYGNKSYIKTIIPNQDNIAVQRRTNVNRNEYKKSTTPTQNLKIVNSDFINMDQTQRITFPIYDGIESEYTDTFNEFQTPIKHNGNIGPYLNELDSSFYTSNTTPIPSENYYGSEPTDGNYYQNYQTTINPAVFEQTTPVFIENGHKPSETPEITISQNIVTSTVRPGTERNGINLEVNQNVKIFGVGRSKPIVVAEEHPAKVFEYNDRFYTSAIPEDQPRFSETYPDYNYEELDQGTVEITGIGNPNNIYPIGSPITHTDTTLIESNSDFQTNLQTQPQDDSFVNPVTSPNNFQGTGLAADEELTKSRISTELIPINRIIGEDFSGPKQPQSFNPDTGYHYK